jgi:hypothetical protein
MNDQAMLDLVDAAMAALLSGGAIAEWREGSHLVKQMTIDQLLALKQTLENRIVSAGGGMLLPIREVDV